MDISTYQDSQNEPTVHLTIDSNRQFDQSQPLFSQDLDYNQEVIGIY